MTFIEQLIVQAIQESREYTNVDLQNRIKSQIGLAPSVEEIREAARNLQQDGYLKNEYAEARDIWSIKEPPKVSRAAVNTVARKVAKQF